MLRKKTGLACFVVCMCAVLWTSSTLAAGGPSAQSCSDLGKINIECRDCATGEFIGMVTVDAVYAPEFESCNGNYRQARDLCSNAYLRQRSDIGMKWEYWLGGTQYSNKWPKHCQY